MLKRTIDNHYHAQLFESAVELEKEIISTELNQESIYELYTNRVINGLKGLSNMTTSELEAHIDIDPDYAVESYLRIFVDTITKQHNSSELDLLLRLLADKNIQMPSRSPRKIALINHLRNVAPYDGYKQATEVYSGDDTVLVAEDKNGVPSYFKVYTEEECIDELVDWYESDFASYTFSVDEIADVLSMSNETVIALGLLNNITDCLVGDGTEQLLALLKTVGKLKDLAANAKDDNFMVLAKDDYAYKSGGYYILEDYDYYVGVVENV